MKEYFNPGDDFKSLLNKIFADDRLTIENIPIGWTNIVQRISARNNFYIGRFPRDDFWSEILMHENKISNYVHDKVSIKISRLNLHHDIKDRVFTVHEEIPGTSFSKKINDLTTAELKFLAEDVADFLAELHGIDVLNSNCNLENIEIFLDRMLKYHAIDLKIPVEYKNSDILIHGDFNPKNIILNEQNRLAGVIDFGFATVGNVEWDLARVCRECPTYFENDLINFYEQKSGRQVNMGRLEILKKLWEEICEEYIEYMLNKNKLINLGY
ncbi:MAG: aminoglycoside phosphotransferase family protein [Cytophagales bacterium]|jgi:aminoglycoside phosphotransferase (APT) family kinase protein|nr:aminoglycoside phosphotransferase family protein [Cytophagales bacterium]